MLRNRLAVQPRCLLPAGEPVPLAPRPSRRLPVAAPRLPAGGADASLRIQKISNSPCSEDGQGFTSGVSRPSSGGGTIPVAGEKRRSDTGGGGRGHDSSHGISGGSDDGRDWGLSDPKDYLRTSRTLPELVARVESGVTAWVNSNDLSTLKAAFNLTATLGTRPDADSALATRALDLLARNYLPLVPKLRSAFDCAAPLWACAKAGYWGGGLAEALLARMGADGGRLLEKAKDQDHSNLWWSMTVAPDEVRDAASTRQLLAISALCVTETPAERICPQACANMLLGCAKLGFKDTPMVQHLAGVAERAAGRMAEQQVLVTSRSKAVGFSPQELANATWALAKLGYADQTWYAAAVEAASQAGAMRGAIPQAWAILFYTLALVRHRPDDSLLAAMLAGQQQQQQQQAGSAGRPPGREGMLELLRATGRLQECANLLWALATLDMYDERLVDVLVARLSERVHTQRQEGTEQDLCTSLWALAVMGPNVLSRYNDVLGELLRDVVRRWEQGTLGREGLTQLWLVQLELKHAPGCGELAGILAAAKNPAGLPLLSASKQAMVAVWQERDACASLQAHCLAGDVSSALEGMVQLHEDVLSVELDCFIEGLCTKVDAVVKLANGRRIGVQMDGPTRFLANRPYMRTKDGNTQLRDRQLGRMFGAGDVVTVPWWEWNEEKSKGERAVEKYLCCRLGVAM